MSLIQTELIAQDISFVFLEKDLVNGSCVSQTDSSLNIQCYGVQYVPDTTGSASSYTLEFIGNCTSLGSPFLDPGNQSCVQNGNTLHYDACDAIVDGEMYNKFLLTISGNGANIPIVKNQPIILHQVCFDLPLLDTILLEKNNHTIAIDIQGGDPYTGESIYMPVGLVNEYSCKDSPVCSLNFGESTNRISFDTNASNNIVDANNLSTSVSFDQSFDVYDELNKSCVTSGGADDIVFDFQMLNTSDINENGIVDEFAGVGHNLKQGANGIEASIPFNIDGDSESSAGDIRGYSIEVTFASHLAVKANQLTVHLDGVNSAGTVFESGVLVFQDENGNDYASISHQGFYNGENDLSGNCNDTAEEASFDITGAGAYAFQSSGVVNRTDPCSIQSGIDGNFNSPSINAQTDAGLDANAIVSGFKLIVYGEDIATPAILDDGSGLAPDDGIRANALSTSVMTLQSTLKGITIEGCVFKDDALLPLEWNTVKAAARRNQVEVLWSTSDEINTENYIVEWSDKAFDFKPIAEVRSNNQIGENHYKWLHKDPSPQTNYYRIKQVDLDGRYTYSDIVSADISKSSREVNLYPNPASQLLYFDNVDFEEKVSVQVFDVTGKKVLDMNLESNSIVISHLENGLYHLIIGSGNEFQNMSFVKTD